jgi:NAD(P)-dependent dehydrogenase (short-subunit alcohol dehydrogenase family)
MDDVLGYAGRHVVVTGAASGMGEATARILGELGARVTALDVKESTVEAAARIQVDLRDPVSIGAAVDAIDTPVFSLFSCAGLPGPPFSDVDVVLVNFVGARLLVERLVPKMEEGSSIGLISSAAGIGWQQQLPMLLELADTEGFDEAKAWVESHPEAMPLGGYVLSKQVIDAWVSARASGLAALGIRLNCINPGPTDTPMMPQFHAIAGKELIDTALGPIGRYSTAEEQAWPLIMLNSPRMSYVTGEVLWTDGGFQGALVTGRLQAAWASGGDG